MQIETKDVEEKILRETESAKRRHTPMRCFHLALSRSEEKERGAMNVDALIAAIVQTVDDNEGRIYQCADGDLFVFSNLLT